MLSFKPTFSLSSFTFIKRLFSSSSLSAIRVVSSAYLRLLIFLLAILVPACASSILAFHTIVAHAAAVDTMSARIGDGQSMWADGVIAHVNAPARALGVSPGMPSSVAAQRMLA